MGRKIRTNLFKIAIFLILANLPYIVMTNLVGVDTFLDSFDNPDYYLYMQNTKGIQEYNIPEGNYIILQTSAHPEFQVKEGDAILYTKDGGDIVCNAISQIYSVGPIRKYGTTDGLPIYDRQILGKVVGTVDNNFWNILALKIWDLSIKNLNINVAFEQHNS